MESERTSGEYKIFISIFFICWIIESILKEIWKWSFQIFIDFFLQKKVNSECYTGWMDDWSGGHHSGSASQLVQTLQGIRDMNASVNM